MINWISLEEKKPEKPISEIDIDFKNKILFIKDNELTYARWFLFGYNNFKLCYIDDERFADEIDLKEFTHWTEVNKPENQ